MIDCGIPPLHKSTAPICRCGKMDIVGKLCTTDLDYCVVFVDQVDVFLEHVHRTLKASERLMPNFLIVFLYFTCLLALVSNTTTTAAILTLDLNRSHPSRLRSQLSRRNFRAVLGQLFSVLTTKVFANIIRKRC